MNKEHKIKKEIKWKQLKIQLFEISNPIATPYESISNLIAVDETNNFVWRAEIPKTHYDSYYDIDLDLAHDHIVALSGIGYRYILSPVDGKIINYYLIK